MASKKPKPNTKSEAGQSPVVDVTRRDIRLATRLTLVALAGGRCQFDGCNRFLFEHHVTLNRGNFGQAAHIVAYSPRGPRGDHDERPIDIHNVSNLMLLCPTCHKEIDEAPDAFSVEVLRENKTAHEERIRLLTNLSPERKTTILTMTTPVRGQKVSIPFSQVVHAVSPRYPSSHKPQTIDLSILDEEDPSFLSQARSVIRRDLDRILGPGSDFDETGHLSLFAMGRISLLMFLGSMLGNKISVDLYQRHRDTQDWTWKTDQQPAGFGFHARQEIEGKQAALLLSLSGPIRDEALPATIRKSYAIYEIYPRESKPSPSLVRTRQDLANFRAIYLEALSAILANHGLIESLAIFPAIPIPVAVVCGQELLPKVHPSLEIFELEDDGYEPVTVIKPKSKRNQP